MRGELAIGHRVEHLDRPRPLDGDHRVVGRLVVDAHVELPTPLAQPRSDLRAVAGVHHQPVAREPAFGQLDLIDQHVVEHAARVVAHQRVADLPRRHVVDAPREDRIEKRAGVGAVDDQPAHVRDVEQAQRPAAWRDARRRSSRTAPASTSRRSRPCARHGRRASREAACD